MQEVKAVKTMWQHTRLDPDTARLLAVIAQNELRGNESAAVRLVIREAARVRGLDPAQVSAGVGVQA